MKSNTESEDAVASMRSRFADIRGLDEEYVIAMRDNRAMWAYLLNIEIIRAAIEQRRWMEDAPGAMMPERFLSKLLRPGGDGDEGMRHRRMAYVRASRCSISPDTESMRRLQASDFALMDVLGGMCDGDLVERAKTALRNEYAYVEKAFNRKYDEHKFVEIMEEKVDAYVDILDKMSEWFSKVERLKLGDSCLSPGEAELAEEIGEICEGVDRLLRRAKVAPASKRAQTWVCEKWEYYKAHPEALRGSQERKRVYTRDVWDTVREMAASNYGIASHADFKHILKAAHKSAERSESRQQESLDGPRERKS